MAAKRLRQDEDEEPETPKDQEIQRVMSMLETVVRRAVKEGIENGLSRSRLFADRQEQMQIISPESSSYRLVFNNQPHVPIFTGMKIEDADGSRLQILLVTDNGPSESTDSPSPLPSQIKIELVVLDGDFPSNDDWTSDEFDKAIQKERKDKRPLLSGEVNITMRNGFVIVGDLQITDNSSWIPSGKFRIGARVVPGSCGASLIKEAITDKFNVRDQRGEPYKKHYPPFLTDEVWRLEKIAKNGAFHRRLTAQNIHNVQGFLKLWSVRPNQLREILGQGMSENKWKIVTNHAKTCDVGNKTYLYCGRNFAIFLNSICEVVRILIDGIPHSFKDLPQNSRDYVQQLVLEAYEQWPNLREAHEMLNENIAQVPNESTMVQSGLGSPQWQHYDTQDLGIEDFHEEYLEEDGSSFRRC